MNGTPYLKSNAQTDARYADAELARSTRYMRMIAQVGPETEITESLIDALQDKAHRTGAAYMISIIDRYERALNAATLAQARLAAFN
jgi:molecular chaperone GrpE (heat shock protein)